MTARRTARSNSPTDGSAMKPPVQFDIVEEIEMTFQSPRLDATVEEWLLMLNERVFFWPSEDRLKHFLQAASYAKSAHLVIEVDTKALLDHYDERVFISSMNTGTTSPYAAPRGRSTFQLVTEYPRRRRSTVA